MALADRPEYERAALAYCAPRGIALSVFFGRVVYPGDPGWLEDDTVAALDWLADESGRCRECHTPLDQTTGKANEDKWNAELSGHCDACRALDRAGSIAAGRDDLNPTAGAKFRVWRDEDD